MCKNFIYLVHQTCSTGARRLLPMPKLLCSGNQPIGLFAIANTPQSKPKAGTTRGCSRCLEQYGMQLTSLGGNLELPASQPAVYATLLPFCTGRGQSHNDNCALRLLFFVVETKKSPLHPAIRLSPGTPKFCVWGDNGSKCGYRRHPRCEGRLYCGLPQRGRISS